MDLSIIILSFNTKDITDECLSRLQSSVISCQKSLGNKIEVIVVDNASSDGSAEMIEKKHSWVNLIASKVNTGFSKGNNLGLKKAKHPYVLFLNSDCFIEENTLTDALNYFKTNPEVSALGPKLVFGDGSFQPSAGNLPTPMNTIYWILGIALLPGFREMINPFHPNYKYFFKYAGEVGWISGAFFMVKKEVLKKVAHSTSSGQGVFDETIFMYFEEVELCYRIKAAGFKIHYNPEIKVIHLHGASIGQDSTEPLVRELKGLRYYFQKYYKSSYLAVKWFLILGLVLRVIAFSFLGKTKKAHAYIEGLSVV